MYVLVQLVPLCLISQARLADYSRLPSTPDVDICFLLDPLVATGGTACAALTMLVDWGIPCKPGCCQTRERLMSRFSD